jgi:3-oxoacyl-[acyl-carrier-protein] synthase-3
MLRSVILGCGAYLPQRTVTNADLSQFVDTSDEWIRQRTGICERHIAAEGEKTSDLAIVAARRALEMAGLSGNDIDLLVVATTTPDQTFPATAVRVQRALEMWGGAAFDIQAVCSGFVFALATADNFIRSGQAKRALVIGAETFSRLLDWEDRGTCVLFGDGAGAVVVEPVAGKGTTDDKGLLGFALRCDGTKTDLLHVDGGVSTTGDIGHLRMQGNHVFRHAVVNIAEAVEAAALAAGVDVKSVDWFVPHQANQRILKGVADRLGIDEARVISTVAEHANTSAASIPLALAQGIDDGRIKVGDLILMEAMGGGLTWGACALRL